MPRAELVEHEGLYTFAKGLPAYVYCHAFWKLKLRCLFDCFVCLFAATIFFGIVLIDETNELITYMCTAAEHLTT